jgi:sugar O-acyltransferase (sialic acid O-acetyltransferase NeuD family)
MTMQRIVVAGAGGFGREVMAWVRDCEAAGRLPPLGGFIDDRVEAVPEQDVTSLGTLSDYVPRQGDRFIVAVGSPPDKRKLVETLRVRGAQYASLVHPNVVLTSSTSVEEGLIMCPFSMATANVHLGPFLTLLSFSGFGHDARAGSYCTVSSHVDVMGYAELGNEVFVGSGARIMPKVSVGDGARIGAGALVMRPVKPGTTVYSAPAKLLKIRSASETP